MYDGAGGTTVYCACKNATTSVNWRTVMRSAYDGMRDWSPFAIIYFGYVASRCDGKMIDVVRYPSAGSVLTCPPSTTGTGGCTVGAGRSTPATRWQVLHPSATNSILP